MVLYNNIGREGNKGKPKFTVMAHSDVRVIEKEESTFIK